MTSDAIKGRRCQLKRRFGEGFDSWQDSECIGIYWTP